MTARHWSIVAAMIALPSVALAQAGSPTADLIVTNAHIYTVSDVHPTVAAMAIANGRILFTGSEREARALAGPNTRVLDLHGATVIPGMIDAHAHLTEVGIGLREVDLRDTRSEAEVVARIAERARSAPAGAWIIARGWDQNRWGDTRFPTRAALDKAVPDHPVAAERVDGHALLVNAAALALAHIDAKTPDPSGGRILHDASGAPTGVVIDNAENLIYAVRPSPSATEIRLAIDTAMKEANRVGLTGVHEPGIGRDTIEQYEQLGAAGKMTVRVYVMVSGDSTNLAYYMARGPRSNLYDGHLSERAIKLYMDGALGSRGAALLDPYSDDPGNIGLLRTDTLRVERVAGEALARGFQLCVHAIGDRGNRLVLNAYERAFTAHPTADHRFRIEHAQIISYDDIPRFAQLGVIPSMQTSHQTSDMYWAANRLGPARIYGAYAWRALLDAGSIIPNGTDAPVEHIDPLIGFHAAITRQDAQNWPPGGWHPEERMTRDEALRAMTLWPAYAGFAEHDLGSLEPGKRADFVVLDQDIMTVAPERILQTHVVATYVGGMAVYQSR